MKDQDSAKEVQQLGWSVLHGLKQRHRWMWDHVWPQLFSHSLVNITRLRGAHMVVDEFYQILISSLVGG